jgi:hypothetical protein
MLALGAFSPAGNLSEGSAFSLSHSHLDSYPKRRGFRTPMLNPWFALSFKAVQLGIDAQNVMALRMMRLASGGTHAQNEMTRMVIEKATAAAEAQVAAVGAAMAGHQDHVVAGKALNVIRKRVGANKRRLSRR